MTAGEFDSDKQLLQKQILASVLHVLILSEELLSQPAAGGCCCPSVQTFP